MVMIVTLVVPSRLPSLSASALRTPDATPAQEQAAIERFARFGLPVYCGAGRNRLVALTFDDGPTSITPRLLGLLRRAGGRATFFVIGSYLRTSERARYARWEARRGAIGDHTWTHTSLTGLSPAQVALEITHAKQELSRVTRAPIDLFRPPYDERDPAIDHVVQSLGLVQVLWSVDPRDWAASDWQTIGSRVLAGLRPGAIVLMHETRPQTLDALKNVILPALSRKHLAAVSVPDLLALDPPSLSQLRRGYGGCTQ